MLPKREPSSRNLDRLERDFSIKRISSSVNCIFASSSPSHSSTRSFVFLTILSVFLFIFVLCIHHISSSLHCSTLPILFTFLSSSLTLLCYVHYDYLPTLTDAVKVQNCTFFISIGICYLYFKLLSDPCFFLSSYKCTSIPRSFFLSFNCHIFYSFYFYTSPSFHSLSFFFSFKTHPLLPSHLQQHKLLSFTTNHFHPRNNHYYSKATSSRQFTSYHVTLPILYIVGIYKLFSIVLYHFKTNTKLFVFYNPLC